MVISKGRVRARRARLGDAGLVLGLVVLAGCGTGYREGAAGGFDAGSDAHGEAIVAIAREMGARECTVFGATDQCDALRRELTRELNRCSTGVGCSEALAAAAEGEAEEVTGYLAISGIEASMKALGEHFGRRR